MMDDPNGPHQAQSILDAVPTPNQILDQLQRNADESRILRSLYKIARKIEAERQPENLKESAPEILHLPPSAW